MKSKYKYVHYNKHYSNRHKPYRGFIAGEFRCTYATEREAALAIDKHLISQGKAPINILRPKQ